MNQGRSTNSAVPDTMREPTALAACNRGNLERESGRPDQAQRRSGNAGFPLTSRLPEQRPCAPWSGLLLIRSAASAVGSLRLRSVVLGMLLVMFATAVNAADVDYIRDIKPILKARCYSCHGGFKQEASLRLDTANSVRKGGDSGAAVNQDAPSESVLLQRVTATDADERMPPEGDALTGQQIELLTAWIKAGAVGPANEIPQKEPTKHWAFQPPTVSDATKSTSEDLIDRFIDGRLTDAGLRRNPPASAVTLVRRMFLDMHGLPPSVKQVEHWSARLDEGRAADGTLNQQAVSDLIEFLLSSPRYGERWAQHWLDIVRYADTHGFEVNTPRLYAWPYRDYVIRAFNEDKPYNDFILDQLAGDSTGEDAATGFLVAAAVLLPGQIGKDEESKRLARQDSLDEIIVGTSATFLGLTLGCARCHDHKFDPFTQRDYYAMQAFFAGVEYGDRELRDGGWAKRKEEAKQLQSRVDGLAVELRRFEPIAYTGRTIVIDDEDHPSVAMLRDKQGHGTNPDGKGRGYANDPGSATRVPNLSGARYTWWANKPGEDVFTWNPTTAGKFRIWISWGAHGSGVHTRDARYVLDRDGNLNTRDDQQEIAEVDQYYFAGIDTGESEKKPLWSGLFDAGIHELTDKSRLILRGGDTGTGITADVIVLQEATDEVDQKQSLPQIRGPVSPLHNVEQFSPVDARFVRFTTFETSNNNRYEPCIDELEVFTAGGSINVALATNGVKATSSGNYSNSGKHQLPHINDGKYGNSHSWISNEKGGGWVQLEFPEHQTIDRIVWARDREGNFPDRLPVRYRIDVSLDGKEWTSVAQSVDRARVGTPHDTVLAIQRNAGGKATDAVKLARQVDTLRKRIDTLLAPSLVYGGRFRTPDQTFVLHRGDPEQPGDTIDPHVPAILDAVSSREPTALAARIGEEGPERPTPAASAVGSQRGSQSLTMEQQRRLSLARWIANDQNPLTARVLVNRIWQFHFGRGLVDTPSDFGVRCEPPSHLEMLDALVVDFIKNGWSIKRLHRAILSSTTFQQSARVNVKAAVIDGDCRLFWRFPSRRLEGEAIRDSMLAINGRLNLEMGGPGFSFFKTRGGLSGFPPVEEFGPNELRRMIYSHHIRMESVPVFGAFDCPDAGQPAPKRSQSTTAIQALNLFNSSFVIDQARAFADRVKMEAGNDLAAQVTLAWRLAMGRAPNPAEKSAALTTSKEHGLETVCRALFNSNEFLFIP